MSPDCSSSAASWKRSGDASGERASAASSVAFARAVWPTACFELRFQPRVRHRIGFVSDGTRRGIERLEHASLRLERDRELIPGRAASAIGSERGTRGALRFAVAADHRFRRGDVGEQRGVAGRALGRLRVGIQRGVDATDRRERSTEIGPRGNVITVERDHAAKAMHGADRVAVREQRATRSIQRDRIARVARKMAIVERDRVGIAASTLAFQRRGKGRFVRRRSCRSRDDERTIALARSTRRV